MARLANNGILIVEGATPGLQVTDYPGVDIADVQVADLVICRSPNGEYSVRKDRDTNRAVLLVQAHRPDTELTESVKRALLSAASGERAWANTHGRHDPPYAQKIYHARMHAWEDLVLQIDRNEVTIGRAP